MTKEDEFKVLELLQTPDIKSAEIIFGQDYKVDMVKVKTIKPIDKNSRVYENISKNGYHTITVKTRLGNVIYSENIRYHKLNK